MDGRERLRIALSHQEPDRIPFDLGAFGATGIHRKAYINLRKYLGFPEKPTVVWDPMQQLADIDEDVLQLLKVDARRLDKNAPSNWKLEFVDDGSGKTYVDEWGIRFHMPEGGFYFDPQGSPLQNAETLQDIENYPWPDVNSPERFDGLRERAEGIRSATGAGLTVGSCFVGFFEGINWLRGFEQSMVDLYQNRILIEAIMEKIAELKIKYWSTVLPLYGDCFDVVSESDDLGSQHRPLISPAIYRKLIKPLHTKVFSTIKRYTDAPIFFHSCGSVREIIPDFIESGVDILNPVQVSAANMDTAELKREFGKDLSFWGGGCDTQHILPNGTPQQVKEEVKRRINDLAPGGGFIFNPVHNIQAGVPPQNIMAMGEAWCDYGVYG